VIFSIRAQFGHASSAPPSRGGPRAQSLVGVCKVGAFGSMFSQQHFALTTTYLHTKSIISCKLLI